MNDIKNENAKKEKKDKKKYKLIVIATVGGSPLPVYVGLQFLTTKFNENFKEFKIYLIETEESKQITNNIREILFKDLKKKNHSKTKINIEKIKFNDIENTSPTM
ncbi:MAG: hypothetical protein ACTSSL_04465 [Candidatus Heimdallarchaeaceae archaeon]